MWITPLLPSLVKVGYHCQPRLRDVGRAPYFLWTRRHGPVVGMRNADRGTARNYQAGAHRYSIKRAASFIARLLEVRA